MAHLINSCMEEVLMSRSLGRRAKRDWLEREGLPEASQRRGWLESQHVVQVQGTDNRRLCFLTL